MVRAEITDPARPLRAPAAALRRLIAFVLIWPLLALPALAERHAFVVGVGDYTHLTPLDNSVSDARLVGETLARLDFTVDLVENPTQQDLVARLDLFVSKVPDGATVLFYFSGHGIQFSGENYLIPADAKIVRTADLFGTSMTSREVLARLYGASPGSVIVVLDACRNNPLREVESSEELARSLATMEEGLALIPQQRTGTLVAFSTAPGEVSLDGIDFIGGYEDNSPFTVALSGALMAEGRSIEQVFKAARAQVVEVTGGRQIPWENSSLVQAIVLRPVSGQDSVASADPCDLAAAHPADPDRVGPSVTYQSIDPQRAIPACEAAVAAHPDEGRFWTLLGRAYDRAGRGEDAMRASRKGMELGYLAAWHNIGNLYAKGLGVEQDYARAYEYFAYAAERGHPEDQHNLGVYHLLGQGVPQDYAKARHWLETASAQNWSSSLNRLGLMHQNGLGGPVDAEMAVHLFTRSVNLGDAGAMVNLANAYRKGFGVDQDLARAFGLFERAALQGNRAAFVSLGNMLEQGEGTDPDPQGAAFWFTLASRAGDQAALEAMMRLRATMTPAEIEALERRIEDWDLRQFG